MANLFDYLAWRGDLSLLQSPFNPVDNIILSQLSYLPFNDIVSSQINENGITVGEAAEIIKKKMQDENFKLQILYKDDPALIDALASSVRFNACSLCGYVNHIDPKMETQFSAICVFTADGYCNVVYRGTDLSLVGWKEDFNMSFNEVIPAQIEAAEYLEQAASLTKKPLRLCGHSKGGNLAVYAASNCSKKIQNRISEIYSNDAPGFHENVINSEGFAAVKSRIRSFVPQSSVVGMLFEHGCEYKVIKSSKKGLLQHELYTWEVAHNDMVHADEITLSSRFVDRTLRDWIGTLDMEKRGQFTDALYQMLASSEVKSLNELETSWLQSAGRFIKIFGKMDKSTRRLLRETMVKFIRSATNNFGVLLKPSGDTEIK